MGLWRRETLIGLWQRDPAQGRRIDHMTTFLAQTAVASICTIYDLLLLPSSSSCRGKLLSAQIGQNGAIFGCKAINNNLELFIFPSPTLVCMLFFHARPILYWDQFISTVYPFLWSCMLTLHLFLSCLYVVNCLTIFWTINTTLTELKTKTEMIILATEKRYWQLFWQLLVNRLSFLNKKYQKNVSSSSNINICCVSLLTLNKNWTSLCFGLLVGQNKTF